MESAEDVAHPANLSAYAFEFLLNTLVAAVHVVHAVENRFAVCYKGRQDQRSGGTEIGAHYSGSGERRRTADGSRTTIDLNVRTHAHEFLHMHEAVFEDVLFDDTDAL